jgi:predicted ATPase/class 3 adenylate cyclase
MSAQPSGVVTFLFTDIEGSTRRWEDNPDSMDDALERHDLIMRSVLQRHGGYVFSTAGDSFAVAFDRARAAVTAAVDIQRALQERSLLPVRIGINTGEAIERDGDYFGPAVNRAARVMSAGHGGQILVAGATAALVDDLDFVDLGERRLRDLSEPVRICQVHAEGLRVDFPPLDTVDSIPGNLPAQGTSFVGRDAAIAEIGGSLRAHRLVTLVGVGGIGKTRLALQAAAAMAGEFRDGAWLVELASVPDASVVTEAVAAIFAVAPQAGRNWTDGIVESLRGRHLLLVLDNCEHVLDEAARLAETLVAQCPDTTILATSREALGIAGEGTWPVPSLEIGPGSSASTLFVERAHSAAPDFDPSADAAVIAEICRRLDGIPLAIELAAARVRSMSPAQIRDRLDERFRLLTGARRSSERHQTLRNAVRWSFDLLDDNEQRVVQQAAVFAGGFTLTGASALCTSASGEVLDEFEMLDVLDSLVRKSLIQVERSDEELRYSMLETIRQFAEEELAGTDAADAVRDRHAGFFADQIEAVFEAFRSPREATAYPFVDAEMANLRSAFQWANDRGLADSAIRVAACTHQIARFALRTETFGWAAEVADLARRTAHRKLPLLLTMACDSAWTLGLLEDARRFGEEATALADSDRFEPLVWAYADLAQIAFFDGDVDAGLELLREGARHPADLHDRFALALLVFWGGLLGHPLPDDETIEALDQINAAGVPTAIAWALVGRAAALAEREPATALDLQQQAIALYHACGNQLVEQAARGLYASALAASDDPDVALGAFGEIVDAWRINGDTILAQTIGHLVVLLARLGQIEAAARLFGAVVRTISLDALVPALETTMTAAREALGAAAFDAARDAGGALSYQDAGDLAHELIARARADLHDAKPAP